MIRAALLAAAAAAIPSAAFAQSAAPAAAPAAAASADPAMLARAKDLFHRLQTGSLDRSQFDDNANMNLDVDTVSAMSAQLAPLGPPQTFVQQSVSPQQDATFYTYAVGFKNGSKLNFVFSIDAGGKFGGIELQPAS